MKASRPSTAIKDNKFVGKDSRYFLSNSRRPQTATSDSLKKIIQVIEQTLNKGAQTILTKINNKHVDRYSKMRHHTDLSQYRLPKQNGRTETEYSHFGTELLIHNSTPVHGQQRKSGCSQKLIRSIKGLCPSHEKGQFIPYQFRTARYDPQQCIKQQKYPRTLKKSSKYKKTLFAQVQKQNIVLAPIDKWQNDASLLNLSFLLN